VAPQPTALFPDIVKRGIIATAWGKNETRSPVRREHSQGRRSGVNQPMMKNDDILIAVFALRQQVRVELRLNPDRSEGQLVDDYLATLNLELTDHHAILDEYWRRAPTRRS
jgi:hypothetical protein